MAAAGAGDTIELLPGRYRADVAVVAQARLTLRGLGRGAVFEAAGRSAEDKAILVVRGDVTVENCSFRGARVPAGNGAGIRFERGRLTVRRCRFFDNEMGLLANNDPTQELVVEDCAFGAAPRHEGLLHHLLYVGAIGSFTLSGSRFGQGWRGHLVKTRALRNRILYNRLDDGPDGEASYELEFPNGGDNLVLGNVIVQSPRSQNPALLSMGAEARDGMQGRLVLAHNTLVNLGDEHGRFVHLWAERLQGEPSVRSADNLFVGPGDATGFDAGKDGNRHVGLDALRDAAHGDDRLVAASSLAGRAVALPADETPRFEFQAPAGTRPLPPGLRLSPGALQRSG
ncbi:MAG: hypothetical protein KGI90_15240 [Burkholderiales bacterium]|nr:hypothetical protein [Burkholderiales bacterium]